MRLHSRLSLAFTLLLSCLLIPALASARDLPDFVELVSTNEASVVNISTKQNTAGAATGFHGFPIPELPEGSPFQDFLHRFFGEKGPIPEDFFESRSLGSGFIISPDGDVLTNAHVVEGADEIIVRTSDRREFVARLIGTDRRSDIALLKIDAEGLPAVRIGSSKELRVGEWVLAIGSPFGFESSATAGIVSAKGRSLPSENYVPFIQTDVAINPGNSGGPLFNLDGEVVGVNSQIYSRTGGFMGLSFAIPIDVAMDVAHQLKTQGRVSRGWLGVMIQDVTRELAHSFGLTQPRGALVAQVLPESPAEAAGLLAGDVILSFNGRDVPTSSALPPMVGATAVGSEAEVMVLRGGQRLTLSLIIGELPEDETPASTTAARPATAQINRLGLVLGELDAEQRDYLGLHQGGVVVEGVNPGPAERAGLRAGDVILMLDRQPTPDLASFKRVLDAIDAGRTVAVLVQRGDSRLFYPLTLPNP